VSKRKAVKSIAADARVRFDVIWNLNDRQWTIWMNRGDGYVRVDDVLDASCGIDRVGRPMRRTKEGMIYDARTLARGLHSMHDIKTQVVVHLRNGQYDFENTYGDDPERSPG
jgi:hypothetical protein